MKRSESILVYGVTGILVIILVVAVMFGGEGGATTPMGDRVASGPDLSGVEDITSRAVDPATISDVPAADPAADGLEPEAGPGPGDASIPGGESDLRDGSGTGEAPLNARAPSVHVLIGSYDTVKQLDGTLFRRVRVRQGETFSTIVERFTGSVRRSDEVRALNEQVDPDNLLPGDELLLPWVDDAELIAAWEARRDVPVVAPERAVAVREAPVERRVPGVAAEAAGTVHVLQPGESLWKLAEQRVGRGRASAYVDEIVRVNGIADASRVRAGQKLTLPPAQ